MSEVEESRKGSRYDLTLSFTGLHQLEMLGLAQGGATPAPGAARTEGPGANDEIKS